VGLKIAVGIPEITQVVALTEAHDGRAGLPDFIRQAVMLAPFLWSNVGATDIVVPTVPILPVAFS
jgi:hypothetical protein